MTNTNVSKDVSPISGSRLTETSYESAAMAFHKELQTLLTEFPLPAKETKDDNLNPFFISYDGEKESESPEIKAFNDAWTKSSKALEKTPLEPLVSELGKQLASGKLDPEALQKVLKDIKVSEDDFGDLSRKFRQLREHLQTNYNLDVEIEWQGGSQVSPSGLTISESNGGHHFNTELRIGLNDKPVAKNIFSAGFAGPIVKDVTTEGAMTTFRKHIVKDEQPKH